MVSKCYLNVCDAKKNDTFEDMNYLLAVKIISYSFAIIVHEILFSPCEVSPCNIYPLFLPWRKRQLQNFKPLFWGLVIEAECAVFQLNLDDLQMRHVTVWNFTLIFTIITQIISIIIRLQCILGKIKELEASLQYLLFSIQTIANPSVKILKKKRKVAVLCWVENPTINIYDNYFWP